MALSSNVVRLTERYVDAGYTVPELSELFGVRKETMRLRLKALDLKANRLPREEAAKLENRNDAICRLYTEGKTLQEVGDKYGITRERVRQILVKKGISERYTSQVPIREQKKENWAKVVGLYMQGYSRQEALDKLGFTLSDIDLRCAKFTRVQRRMHRIASFWKLVDKNGPYHDDLQSNCWVWTGVTNSITGYGMFSWNGKNASTHRLSYTITKGHPTRWVLHSCSNAICVNPDHLYDGTPKENCRDRDAIRAKRRMSFEQAEEVRKRYSAGETITEISKDYPFCAATLYKAARGTTCKYKDSYVSDDKIRMVWEMRGQTYVVISEATGIGVTTIGKILNGRKGNHITGLPEHQKNLQKNCNDNAI